MADRDENMNDNTGRSPMSPAPRRGAAGARRRLLKGAVLAAPAVVTLRSGAALAATSSHCLANPHFQQVTPDKLVLSTSPDSFARRSVVAATFVNDGNTNQTKMLFQYKDTAGNGDGIWRDPDTGNTFSTTGWTKNPSTEGDYLYLAIVDNDGNQIGQNLAPPYDTAHHPVSHSCWVSAV